MAKITINIPDELIINAMTEIADAMINYMEGSDIIPIDTHNLKDGMGVAVYHKGSLRKFAMNPRATVPRTDIGLPPKPAGDVMGKDLIQDLMNNGMTKYGDGSNIVLYSAMPYGDILNAEGVHTGFFSIELVREFESLVDEIMKLYHRHAAIRN